MRDIVLPSAPEAGTSVHESAFESIVTPLSPHEVIQRLSKKAKMGRLAGFAQISPSDQTGGTTGFKLLVSGGIYDYSLVTRLTPNPAGGSKLTFSLELLKKMPWIAAGLIVVSIFPGLQVTHSMLVTYFSWYRIETWWWYLPMVLLMIPVMYKQFAAGRTAAKAEASELVAMLKRELNCFG